MECGFTLGDGGIQGNTSIESAERGDFTDDASSDEFVQTHPSTASTAPPSFRSNQTPIFSVDIV